MADDSDDLDAVLRRTMASLDRQVPAGYFEALPARTLARLDDPAIGAASGAPLQELRDLASETRARLSLQHAAQDAPGAPAPGPGPGPRDDAAVSTVSKAVAMPVSAVSQPPTSVAGAPGHPATAVSQPPRSASPLSPTAVPVDGSVRVPPRRVRRAVWAALAGGVAAAGAVGYLVLGPRETERADVSAMAERRAEVPTSTALPAGRSGSKAGAPAVIARGSVEPVPPAAIAPPTPVAPTPAAPPAPGTAGSYGDELHKQDGHAATPDKRRKTEGGSAAIASLRPPASSGKAKPVVKRPPAAKAGPPLDPLNPGTGAAGAFDSAKPSEPAAGSAAGSGSAGAAPPQQAQIPLDQLIGEGEKKSPPPRPRPTRTSLSTDDIKRGMTAVAGKAKACFNGTQGLARLRLTVAPSGRVVKAAVTGMFAGSPTGACVERAAGAARFPAWDGGPQSFNYSYLLSD